MPPSCICMILVTCTCMYSITFLARIAQVPWPSASFTRGTGATIQIPTLFPKSDRSGWIAKHQMLYLSDTYRTHPTRGMHHSPAAPLAKASMCINVSHSRTTTHKLPRLLLTVQKYVSTESQSLTTARPSEATRYKTLAERHQPRTRDPSSPPAQGHQPR